MTLSEDLIAALSTTLTITQYNTHYHSVQHSLSLSTALSIPLTINLGTPLFGWLVEQMLAGGTRLRLKRTQQLPKEILRAKAGVTQASAWLAGRRVKWRSEWCTECGSEWCSEWYTECRTEYNGE